jgi:drug/metabolite transporter (DMT)-like permease
VSRSRPGALLCMLGASAAFACMAASVKLAALRGVPFGQLLFYRGFISLLLMSAYMRFAGVSFATPHWRAHLQRGVAGFVGMILYFGGLSLLPLAGAVTLNYTSPLMLAGTLLVMHRERPPRVMLAAMLSGFAGILLLMRPSYDSSQWFGVLLALGSAVTAVIAALNIRSLGQLQEPIARTAAYFALYATIGALPWFALSDFGRTDWRSAAYLVAMGVFATLGQVMLTLAYQRGHTLLVSLLGYSQVIFATLFGIALWAEQPPVSSWLAMALIVASGIVATVFVRSTPLRQA